MNLSLIISCILIVIALIILPLIISYKAEKKEKNTNEWEKIKIPLYHFPIRKSKIDLTKIKQIHFAFNYNTKMDIDNINLTKH